MHFVLRPDPAHDRTLAPSLNDSGERVRTEHSVTNSQFVWSGESGEQARYRQIRPTEAIADKVGAAVCKLASVSPRQSLNSLILAPLPYRGSSRWPCVPLWHSHVILGQNAPLLSQRELSGAERSQGASNVHF